MKKIITVLALGLLLAACDPVPSDPSTASTPGENYQTTDTSSGLGMTYGGRLGIEIAPGLVYGFDGSIGLGYGF